MEELYRIDSHYLVPAALIGVVVAIVLLILRRKKNGVRPPYAGGFLIVAILLFVFAFVTVIVIPLIHLVYNLLTVGVEFFYAGLKSL